MLRLMFAAIVALSALPAAAQDDARYRLEKSGDRFIRMDTRNGDMSICEDRAGSLECRSADDKGERSVADEQATTAGLEQRIAEMEARIAVLERGAGQPAALPTDEEFERTLGFMERFFRRFIGIAREFEQDEAPAPASPPQRS